MSNKQSKRNNHLVLPKFLLKKFAIQQTDNFSIYMLDIKNKVISIESCEKANTLLNFYSEENEEYFSKLESQFSDLCKSIFDKIDKDDIGLSFKLNSKKTKTLLKNWSKTNFGRIFFNNPKNISFNKFNPYDIKKRNTIIKNVAAMDFPREASDLIDNSYITLFRNSTKTNFVLGPCHWIENEINNYNVVIFPISPKTAICLIDRKWRKDIKSQLKKNDVAYLNYSNDKFVKSFNNVIYQHTIEVGLNEIYSCSKNELLELIY